MKTKSISNQLIIIVVLLFFTSCSGLSYLQTSVPEEGGINFLRITQNEDNVVGCKTTLLGKTMVWATNPKIALSPDGDKIAYISLKNNTCNIMVKSTDKAGSSVQRTFRNNVTDLSWSPNGEYIAFSEYRGNRSSIYATKAKEGNILQQISNGSANDYCPVYSQDENLIYFTRNDSYGSSIWSFNRQNNLFTQYSLGNTPLPVKGEPGTLLCTRHNTGNRGEIWSINYDTGVETLILSDNEKSFSTPQLSPNGEWIVCMGTSPAYGTNSNATTGNIISRQNLDVYVIRRDGTKLTQLTYHPGNDIFPIWDKDGKSIFFISQRGTDKGTWNIWKMNFNVE